MKVGLVRHFKVKKEYPIKAWLSTNEVMEWFKEYDTADIEAGETELGVTEWKQCFASDMPRAAKTAAAIYRGHVIHMEALREIPMPIVKRNIKLPFFGWTLVLRGMWLFSRTARADIEAARQKIAYVLDTILQQEEGDVLIVSHGALMMYMRKELLRRGFHGPAFGTPKNGKLYIFENESSKLSTS